MPSSIIVLVASLGCLASGVSVVNQERPLMRAEAKADLSAIEVHAKKDSTHSRGIDTCEWDWPVSDDSCGCAEIASDAHHLNHTLIDSEEQCIIAARVAGVSAPGIHKFLLGPPSKNYDYWQQRHPQGCFKVTDCHEDPKGICYFYNELVNPPVSCTASDTLPDGSRPPIEGVPVCKRPRYAYGLKPDENRNCPSGYETIMDDGLCRAASKCQGYRSDCQAEFIADRNNESEYNDFPIGCFEHDHPQRDLDVCVMFNEPMENMPDPHSPEGTPVCTVSNITDFRNEPIVDTLSDKSVVHAATNQTAVAEITHGAATLR
jgi:hypothetical protein